MRRFEKPIMWVRSPRATPKYGAVRLEGQVVAKDKWRLGVKSDSLRKMVWDIFLQARDESLNHTPALGNAWVSESCGFESRRLH